MQSRSHWVIPGANANTFKLASSYDNAIAGTALAVTTDGHANKFTPVSSGDCLANSATAYTASTTGEPLYSDCKVAAGYYISTETSTTDVLGSGALTISPTSHYSPGGASLSEQTDGFVAATRIACPYGGATAATGKSLLTECTPSSTGTGGVAGTTCGAAAVNAKAVGGTCVCKANSYGTPLDTNDAKVLVATKGCTACPFGGTSADGATVLADCTPAQTSNAGGCGAASVNAVAVGGTCHCKAGYYGTPTSTTSGAVATGGCTACPANSVSVAGTGTTIADCKVSAGYYLSAAKTGSATYGTITQAAANKYAAGGTAVNANSADAAPTACPFGGTSAAGSSVVEDCVPDCGASTVNAVNARGTCICAPDYYGAPTSTTSGAVATGGCTACPTNTEAVAGSSALSGCKVKAGYYMVKNVISSTTYTANAINIGAAHGLNNGDQVIYNDGSGTKLKVGGTDVVDGTVYYVVEKATNTFKIATASGGTALVLTAGSTSGLFTSVLQVPADSYGAGGAAADETVTNTITATKTACPYAGTSAAASVALTACTPSCGTASSVKTTISLGTCVCASTHWGKPVDANGLTVGAVTAGCLPIAVSAAIAKAKAPVANPGVITVDAGHGYYTGLKILYTKNSGTALNTGSAVADGTALYVVKLTDTTFSIASSYANAIAASPTKLQIAGAGDDAQTFTPDSSGACPSITQTAYTSTVAGAQTLEDCEVAAGFYISTKTAAANNVVGSFAASQIVANHYAPGGYDANLQASVVSGPVTTTSFACPFAGTTVRAGGKLSDCTPDCGSGTNAVANGGTCVCATTHYGTPVDANGATVAAATQGCSPVAQTAAIPQYAVTVATPGVIRIDGHGLYTGQKLLYTKVGGGTALTTSVGALADGTAQYVIKVDANTFKLATSKTLALAGTALQITNDGDDAQIFTPVSSGVCPTNSATAYTAAAAGTGSLADCKVAAGYYIATESATATDATGLVISQVPANSYGAGGEAASQQTDNDVAATKTACVAKSTSAAGSDAISDCKTAAGFYLSVASPSATGSGRIAKSEANTYSAGGTSISTTTAETATACTYGGTSAIGSDAAADCTPSCGTVAEVSSGTCVCKAGRTGTPTPTTAAVTGGCTATLCAANQKVTSNACAACGAGTNNAAGDDASGADTTCDAISCTADHYVSSNVCTDCAAGSTNAAGDDATGADTTCDIVSGASPLEVKLTSMISFLVIGFLALAM